MYFRSFVWSLVVAGGACFGQGAPGQSLAVWQAQVVAVTGDLVPGLANGEIFAGTNFAGGFPLMDLPMLDDDGRVLFRSQFNAPGGGTVPNNRALFWGDSRASLTMVLRQGDPEPSGLPGVNLSSLGGHRVQNGRMFFGATLAGPGISSSNDTALYAGTPGNFQMVARKGSQVVGALPGVFYNTTFSGPATNEPGNNASGRLLFRSNLGGTGVTGGFNDLAWFTGTPGALVMALRTWDQPLNAEQVDIIWSSPQLNAVGQVLFHLDFGLGTGTPPVTAANDSAVWIHTPGVGNQQILREGDATPIAGTTFALPSGLASGITGVCSFNSSGQALLRSDLAGAVTAGVNDQALFRISLAGHTVVARRGDVAPGTGGATFLAWSDSFIGASLHLNESGAVAFRASLAGPGVTSTNDTGIWCGTPGNLVLVAREGDPVPGAGTNTLGAMTSTFMALNAAGQVVFQNNLTGGTGFSLWAWDPSAGLQLVVRNGDSIEVQPGVFKPVNGSAIVTSGGLATANGGSRSLGFANDGTFAFRLGVSFDGSAAVVKARIGSLTGVPKTISAVAGGTHRLYLNASAAHAGEVYLVLGSLTGTSPGVPLGTLLLPLNLDFYTDFVLQSLNMAPFANTLGILDPSGRGVASLTIPPGFGIYGLGLHHAYLTLGAGSPIAFVSEPAALLILP